MNRWTALFVAMLFSIFVAIGCSNGSGVTPVAPASSPDITGSISGQSQTAHASLLGYYEVTLDPVSQTMEIVADRTAEYTINIIPFLNQMPGSGITLANLDVDSTDPAMLKVGVEFKWNHPFPTVNQYKVYDFMGVIISNGDQTLKYKTLKVGKQGSNTYMSNADGYTRWFNPTEFTTTMIFGWAPGGIQNLAGNAKVNPYKYYANGLGTEQDLWSFITGGDNNDGVFQSGAGRLMQLEFPAAPAGNGLTFAYAAVCCWEEQGAGPYTPYHRDEPIACKVDVTPSLWYQSSTLQGGSLIADINIWSWDQQPTLVKVESTVLTTSHDLDPGEVGGDNYSTYHVDLPKDVTLTGTTGQEFWVIAENSNFTYINVTGVAAPPSSSKLAAFWRIPLFIASEPYNQAPIIDSGVTGPTDVGTRTETYNVTAHDVEGDPMTWDWKVMKGAVVIIASDPGDGAGNFDFDFGAHGTLGDSFTISCKVHDPYGFNSATPLIATISNNPPVVDTGVTGETDPVIIAVEAYSVTAHDPDGDPLSYSWTVSKGGTPVSGYNGVAGDGAGNVNVDWGAVGANDGDDFDIDCDVSDGSASSPATTLAVTTTAVIYLYDGTVDDGGMSVLGLAEGPSQWQFLAGEDIWDENGSSSTENYQMWTTLGTPKVDIPSGGSGIQFEVTHSGYLPNYYGSYGYASGMIGFTTDDANTINFNTTPCDNSSQWLNFVSGTNFNFAYGYNLGMYGDYPYPFNCQPFSGNWYNTAWCDQWGSLASPVTSTWRCNGLMGTDGVQFVFNYNSCPYSWIPMFTGWHLNKIKVSIIP